MSRLRSFELRRGKQVSANREPQNIEYRIQNAEGLKYFIISASGGFDIRFSKTDYD
jgi:hypothetical protein